MDFDDHPEDRAFRAEVRAWLEEHTTPRVAGDLPNRIFGHGDRGEIRRAKEVQALLADARLAGITWPQAYGGRGGTVVQQLIFDDESARFVLATEMFALGMLLAGPTIIAHGTPDQQQRYLTPLLRGEEIWCQLFSEPGAGSDLAGVGTRAVRDGHDWVVSGQKVWTSGAHFSDMAIMLTRTDPEAPKHRGLTFFVLEMHSPGVTVRPLRQMTGDAHFNEVFLDDVRVPGENMLGALNGGWAVTMTTLMNERMMGAGFGVDPDPQLVVGLARRSKLANGERASDDPVVRQSLADIYIRSEVIRFVRYRLLTAIARGEDPGPQGSVIKLGIGQLLRRNADLALRLQGGAGTLTGPLDTPAGAWGTQFLSAPAMRIAGGTDEIQRSILGERILGLPR